MSSSTPLEYPSEYNDLFATTHSAAALGQYNANVKLSGVMGKPTNPDVGIDVSNRGVDGIHIDADVSSNVNVSSVVRLGSNFMPVKWLPTVSYKTSIRGFKNVKGSVDCCSQTLWAEVQEPAYRASITSKVLDGFASEVSVSARLVDEVYGGLFFSYDPSRSGLKQYSYSVLCQKRPELRSGDALFSFDAIRGLGASLRVPICDKASARLSVTPASKEIIVGANVRCPTGTAQLFGSLNIFKKSLHLSGWKTIMNRCTLSLSLESSVGELCPKVGVNVTCE